MFKSGFNLRTNITKAEPQPAISLSKLMLFGSADWEKAMEEGGYRAGNKKKKFGPELLEEAKVENMGESV
jgi:hypothetical protein